MPQRERIIDVVKKIEIRRFKLGIVTVMLLTLSLGLLSSQLAIATSQSDVNGQVLPYYIDNNVAVIVTSPIDGGMVTNPYQTLEFFGNLINTIIISQNGSVIATINPVSSDHQVFTQTVILLPGLNTFVFDLVGGIPVASVSQNYSLIYSQNGAGLDPVVTNNSSPRLRGTVSSPNLVVKVTIEGTTYDAINNGDGTWTLPPGTINPPLADGTYDVILDTFDQIGNLIAHHNFNNAVEIDSQAPIASFDTVFVDKRSPALGGLISKQPAIFELTINGKTYNPTYFSDGTWALLAGTISPELASGEYVVIIRVVDSIGNQAITRGLLTVQALNEIGFIIPPRTGYLRVARLNIPSWLIYLTSLAGLYLLVNRHRQPPKTIGGFRD